MNDTGLDPHSTTGQFRAWWAAHAAFAFDRQLLLAELIGELDWAYNLQSGQLSFGDRFQWQAEVLGTESDEAGTWLWAWANKASNIPPGSLCASLRLQSLGEKYDMPELTEAVLPLEHACGHDFAAIAVGEGLGRAYYRGPHDGGAALLLITDQRLRFEAADPLQRVLTVFPQAISSLELPDHRGALRSYLEHYQIRAADEGGALVVREQGQVVLRAAFDERRRLRQLTGTIADRTSN